MVGPHAPKYRRIKSTVAVMAGFIDFVHQGRTNFASGSMLAMAATAIFFEEMPSLKGSSRQVRNSDSNMGIIGAGRPPVNTATYYERQQ